MLFRSLGVALKLAVATHPIDPARLTAGDRSILDTLGQRARRREWLVGRAALARLPRRIPHARYSLTHSRGIAVAAFGAGPRSIGIDLELRRGVDPRAARFFLTDEESSGLPRAAQRCSQELLRLWTAKEALFKADPDNRHRSLREYRIDAPASGAGTASRAGRRNARFRYASFRVAGGYLSIAAAVRGPRP